MTPYDPEQTVTFGDIAMPAADALCALYNASQPLGFGWLQHQPGGMSREDAAKILTVDNGYTDYVRGRVVKVTFDGELFLGLYDRDNGEGAGKRALRAYAAKAAA